MAGLRRLDGPRSGIIAWVATSGGGRHAWRRNQPVVLDPTSPAFAVNALKCRLLRETDVLAALMR